MPKNPNKIIQGLREAVAYERGNPGSFRVNDFRVRITKDRVVVVNEKTGSVQIMPTSPRRPT